MNAGITKGSIVIHRLSGVEAVVTGIWFNEWSHQLVLNVRVNGWMFSWNATNVKVL